MPRRVPELLEKYSKVFTKTSVIKGATERVAVLKDECKLALHKCGLLPYLKDPKFESKVLDASSWLDVLTKLQEHLATLSPGEPCGENLR